MILERSPRRLPERNDPSVERSEIRQQSDTGRRDSEKTRSNQCRHYGEGRTVSRFECNERRVGQRKLPWCPKSKEKGRRGLTTMEGFVETIGKPKDKFEQYKHHVYNA